MTRIYVGMEDGLALLTSSGTDAGGWRTVRRLPGQLTQCVVSDPRRPEVVYVGTFHEGLWRSRDAGETWQAVGAGLRPPAVMAVAVAANGSASDFGTVYAGTEPSELYRSDDGGDTWEPLPALSQLPSRSTWSFPPRPGTHHVRWIELDPSTQDRLYVSIEQGGVMSSDDGGRTFQDRRPGGPRDAHTLASHPQAPGRVYAAAADGMGGSGKAMMESRDGGQTWAPSGQGIAHAYGWSVAVDPADPAHVLYAGAHSPYQAHNASAAQSTIYYRHNGSGWQLARDGLPEPDGTIVWVLTTHPSESGVFYAASNQGVFRSHDAGQRWECLTPDWPSTFQRQHAQGITVTQ